MTRWKSAGADRRCRGNTWFVPYATIKNRAAQRPHPASFPIELARKCIRLHGLARAQLVLDPFLGIGHAGAAAYYQRWWQGFPDLTWVPQRRAFTEDGVVSELVVKGTHKGDYLGLAPTGKTIEALNKGLSLPPGVDIKIRVLAASGN